MGATPKGSYTWQNDSVELGIEYDSVTEINQIFGMNNEFSFVQFVFKAFLRYLLAKT